tara:strand:- start:62186 stop:62797 length:612 start_codon:yes stop_codon:yes gene_type:complete
MRVTVEIKHPDVLKRFMNFMNDNTDDLNLDLDSRKEIESILKIDQYDEDMCDMLFLENINNDYMMLRLRALSKLSLNIFELYPDKFNWVNISLLDLTEEFIENNIDRLNMEIISTKTLSSEFIIKHHKELDFNNLMITNKLPEIVEDVYSKEIHEYREEMKVKSVYLNDALQERNDQLRRDGDLRNRSTVDFDAPDLGTIVKE